MTILVDRIRLPYPWIKIKNQTEGLLYKLSNVEDQEEAELFLFRLYAENADDLKFFDPEERERVKGLLYFLIEDTKRHKELIAEVMREIRAVGEVADES